VLEHGIALALLDSYCEVGDEVQVRVRDVDIDGRIVVRPFVDKQR
jgi:ribosomal protein S1